MEDPRTLVMNKMKLLISLAQIDGAVAAREKAFIISIARANDIQAEEIEPLFERSHALIIPKDLDANDRFNYLLSMVQLMKIDERMYKEELLFCTKMAENLGYKAQAMFDMLLHVKASDMTDDEKAALKASVQKYVK